MIHQPTAKCKHVSINWRLSRSLTISSVTHLQRERHAWHKLYQHKAKENRPPLTMGGVLTSRPPRLVTSGYINVRQKANAFPLTGTSSDVALPGV